MGRCDSRNVLSAVAAPHAGLNFRYALDRRVAFRRSRRMGHGFSSETVSGDWNKSFAVRGRRAHNRHIRRGRREAGLRLAFRHDAKTSVGVGAVVMMPRNYLTFPFCPCFRSFAVPFSCLFEIDYVKMTLPERLRRVEGITDAACDVLHPAVSRLWPFAPCADRVFGSHGKLPALRAKVRLLRSGRR